MCRYDPYSLLRLAVPGAETIRSLCDHFDWSLSDWFSKSLIMLLRCQGALSGSLASTIPTPLEYAQHAPLSVLLVEDGEPSDAAWHGLCVECLHRCVLLPGRQS